MHNKNKYINNSIRYYYSINNIYTIELCLHYEVIKMRIKYLLLLIVIFLVGCSSNIVGVKDIDLINTRTNEKTTLNANSKTSKLIKEAINKSDKIENLSIKPDFEVIINQNNGEEKAYYFAFNYDNQKTYILKDDNIYEVKDS